MRWLLLIERLLAGVRDAVKASDNPDVGRWRIVGADLWERDYLDLCGPASLVVQADGLGEIAFGAMQASLDIYHGPDEIGFTWTGFGSAAKGARQAKAAERVLGTGLGSMASDQARLGGRVDPGAEDADIGSRPPQTRPTATFLRRAASSKGQMSSCGIAMARRFSSARS